ncbi:UDP-N-acetylmuramate--L-alanine ligase [Candidatus Berkelbacteria bacterium CG1_02_42_45]|uniref:UDP-N-acetylmuramate--L-alanine ligase n=3 Tax=Candidatus Berkelbacteria TaxID=1618330 RepID=A0A1J4RTR8_9BACT|nr:MAG: UDP-N-acetylmuramate--L-alanine ligase [Candidatus Berkelbacteria bacterium CG1_02_42_45]
MWYHLVGISGVSMRAIAQILKSRGHKITGSDLKLSGHSVKNIMSGIDAVIYTSAVTPNSAGWIEIDAAKKLKIPLIKRGKMLADLVADRKIIAISGTHGKTTTTAMIGLTLEAAGFDPLVIVGGEVPEFGGVVRFGQGEWAVVEACEYDRNFLYISANIAVITNIEEEHLDHYPGGAPDLEDTFAKFASQTKDKGFVVVCGDDKNTTDTAELIKKKNKNLRIITYGLGQDNKVNKLDFELAIPGDHNRRNALATIAVANILGINRKIVKKAIKNFRGAKRRFEIKGKKNGVVVIDDYGHHPTEIAALLAGVKEKFPKKKIVAVFWPHQYKRTKVFLAKFSAAFKVADKVVIKEIFFVPGRDKKSNVSGKDIVDLINRERGGKAVFINNDQAIIKFLRENLTQRNVLVTVGIPPVYKIAEGFLGAR